jgi:hypothetical protein
VPRPMRRRAIGAALAKAGLDYARYEQIVVLH